MSHEYFQQMAANWAECIKTYADEGRIERGLELFAKEVSRDTRHAACQIASDMCNKLHNLQLRKP